MEEKLELSESDCRRYYQLVQDKMSPECSDPAAKSALFVTSTRDGEIEDFETVH